MLLEKLIRLILTTSLLGKIPCHDSWFLTVTNGDKSPKNLLSDFIVLVW